MPATTYGTSACASANAIASSMPFVVASTAMSRYSAAPPAASSATFDAITSASSRRVDEAPLGDTRSQVARGALGGAPSRSGGTRRSSVSGTYAISNSSGGGSPGWKRRALNAFANARIDGTLRRLWRSA